MAEKAVQRKSAGVLAESTREMLQGLMPQIPALLPSDISTEQFRAALWLELSGRPALRDCTVNSIRECAIKSATYGLLPGRDCHFLPFNDTRKGGKVATYVPNYFGILLLLDRTGKVDDAFAHAVHEGDEFVCDHLAGLYSHVPAFTCKPPRERGKALFYYACILLTNGKKHVEVMTLDELDAIRRRAPAHDSGPWVTDKDEMCRKTVLKRASKYVKGAPRLQQLLQDDDERQRADIPEARNQENIAALYGDTNGTTPTDYQRPVHVDSKTGQIIDETPLFDLEASAVLDQELAQKD